MSEGFPTLTDAEYRRIQRRARRAVQTCDPELLADVAAALAEHGVTLRELVAAANQRQELAR